MMKVYFIGSGYEVVKTIYVNAKTPLEAIEKAENMYISCEWTFHYCDIEVAKTL